MCYIWVDTSQGPVLHENMTAPPPSTQYDQLSIGWQGRHVQHEVHSLDNPNLLNATVKTQSKLLYFLAVVELAENLYVNDWPSGCNSVASVCGHVREAIHIWEGESMSFAKWGVIELMENFVNFTAKST